MTKLNSVDEMIAKWASEKLDAPIARWNDRHTDPLVSTLAAAAQEKPDAFASCIRMIVNYAQPYAEEMLTPLFGLRSINRTGSFMGGFPFTSGAHPWPLTDEGRPASPILQLNLLEIDLIGISEPAPFLFQSWGNDVSTLDRIIPLDEVNGVEADPEYHGWSETLFRFEGESIPDEVGVPVPTDLSWYDGKLTGQEIAVDERRSFSLGRDMEYPLEEGVDYERDDEVASCWHERILKSLEETDALLPWSASGFFGGQHDTVQEEYYWFDNVRCIYRPTTGRASGLRTLFDGTFAVLRNWKTPSEIWSYSDR